LRQPGHPVAICFADGEQESGSDPLIVLAEQ
jgi:hypothetical protein